MKNLTLKTVETATKTIEATFNPETVQYFVVIRKKRTGRLDTCRRYENEEKALAAVDHAIAVLDEYEARKKERRAALAAERKTAAAEMAAKIKVGTIFYSNWGYDQTNVEFFEVVEKKGMTVKLRELAQESIATEAMSYRVKPIAGQYFNEEIHTKRISRYIKSPIYGNLYLWDGSSKVKSTYA